MFIKNKKGFTLIELLVVIAIIALLASIVLSSLKSSRNKANDAKVKSQLVQVRNAAALYLANTGNYSGQGSSCASNPASTNCTNTTQCIFEGNTFFSDAKTGMNQMTLLSNFPAGTKIYCATNGTSNYFLLASLANGFNAWCVDALGDSSLISFQDMPANYFTSSQNGKPAYTCSDANDHFLNY